MNRKIAHVALLVKDYDEAIEFYVAKLGFKLLEDTKLEEQKRWIVVSPNGENGCSLLLAKASNPVQIDYIGNQTGGRVFLFLQTDNFWRDYDKFVEHKIHFPRPPLQTEYGTVAVFEDLYGNLWDLIEPVNSQR